MILNLFWFKAMSDIYGKHGIVLIGGTNDFYPYTVMGSEPLSFTWQMVELSLPEKLGVTHLSLKLIILLGIVSEHTNKQAQAQQHVRQSGFAAIAKAAVIGQRALELLCVIQLPGCLQKVLLYLQP